MVTVRQSRSGDVLEARSGGGCLGCLGMLFALWTLGLGSIFVNGWRAGDFAHEDRLLLIVAPFVLLLFFLCGLGVGTYRRRYRFHAARRTVTHIEQVFFLPFQTRHWSIDDFSAVDVWLFLRRSRGTTSRIHVLRLIPSERRGAPSNACELGSGPEGKEMREAGRKISEFTGLDLRETPAGVQ